MEINGDKLIQLSILLGSDYTEGLTGIGIVNAIKILNEFPDEDGLGIGGMMYKVEGLILNEIFSNHHIWEVYLHPQVDDSTEEFQWGIPDIDLL